MGKEKREGKKKGKKKEKKEEKLRMKALGLFSGGLDSIVAAQMMKEMGFDIELLHFTSPFFNCVKAANGDPLKWVRKAAKQLGLKLTVMPKGADYLGVIKNAKHGYGTGMNPCVDCRIYTFKKAWEHAKRTGAKFIFTGEVLGERPLSQIKQALETIDRESGLEGKIVRPLSGKLLPATEAEGEGWLKREDLLAISGRGRQEQIRLAKKWHLEYPGPGGGCLLTERHYGLRLMDLLEHKAEPDSSDIASLSLGRHFRLDGNRIIVGRNENENIQLKRIKGNDDLMLECEEGVMGPITLLKGKKDKKAVSMAARLTAYFSDARKEGMKKVKVNLWEGNSKKPGRIIIASPNIDIKKEMKKGLVWIGQM